MITIDQVVDKVRSYIPEPRESLIRKAFDYSAKAHQGQTRKSGHPFVVHPLEVALTLADMRLDESTIAAAILHDTIEDTAVTKHQITALFGAEIADLVDGVTKLSKIQFNTQEEREAENFRKMIIAISKDIRVLLIKLADRLNNLKTLQFMAEDKQIQIAQETLDIYAPLANRLGMQWMKVQLEDLSFQYLRAEIYKQLEKKISRIKKNREQYIERVKKAVMNHLQGQVDNVAIYGRMKHIYSIYRKMERQNITFEQVHDFLAFRIITDTVEQCYEVLGHLHSIWKPVPGRFKDYIAMSKENNYQSLHTTVICLDGERVEFQIRTNEMNEIAEQGIASHWKYKEGERVDPRTEQGFTWLRSLIDWQDELKDSIDFLDTVKLDMFAQDVYAFTPRGDVRALPYSATPIDFAYSIHSDVGTHCTGAKINGRLMPLNYKIQSGDEVEIITNPNQRPSKDWLNMAASSRAKAKIRQFLKLEQQEKSQRLGRSIFEEECLKFKINADEIVKMPSFFEFQKKKGIGSMDAFYAAISYGRFSVSGLLKRILPESATQNVPKEGMMSKIFKQASLKTRNVIRIDGVEDILIIFGKCCSPVPGDRIIGFITRGRGVTIHRLECNKVPSIDPERRVTATWDKVADLVRTAKLRIASENKTGLLASVAQSISDRKINITKAIVRTTKDEKAIMSVDVGVHSVTELNAVIKSVEKIKGIISVERELK